MSRFAHEHPELVGNDPRTHVPGLGSPRFEGDGDDISSADLAPRISPRRLTDSRLNPHGQPWTIEDVELCAHGNERGNCRECALENWDDRVDMEAKAIGRGEADAHEEAR